MTVATCEECGTSYTARRPSSRFCGDTCRKRANRRQGPPVEVPAAPGGVPGPVGAAVRAELAAAGTDATALGVTAVVLADRVDAGGESGTAVASVVRELRAVLADLERNAPVAASPLDELRARRDARMREAWGGKR